MAHPAVVELFGRPRALIGMIHAGALPGTAHARDPLDAIVTRAVDEARLIVGSSVKRGGRWQNDVDPAACAALARAFEALPPG